MLPATNRAADRFVRASFCVKAIPQEEDSGRAVASAFSGIRNASVPCGLMTPEEPNISSTRWRTVFDHERRLYFFESVLRIRFRSVAPDRRPGLTEGACSPYGLVPAAPREARS